MTGISRETGSCRRPQPWRILGFRPLIFSLTWVAAVEILFMFWHPDAGPAGRLWLIGLVRVTQMAGVLLICVRNAAAPGSVFGGDPAADRVRNPWAGLAMLGLDPKGWRAGVRAGVIWTLGFGVLVLPAAGVIRLCGGNPVEMVRFRMPADSARIAALLTVGGMIGPLAEELVFRSLIYGGLRRWGVFAATGGSAVLFTLLHADAGLVQATGGILFALCYERAGHLTAPMLVHVCGNLALFFLSLFPVLF